MQPIPGGRGVNEAATTHSRLLAIGRELGEMPARLEEAERALSQHKALLAELHRVAKAREAEIGYEVAADPAFSNAKQREAETARRVAADETCQINRANTADTGRSIDDLEATVSRLKREFQAKQAQVQILTSPLAQHVAMQALTGNRQARAAGSQPNANRNERGAA